MPTCRYALGGLQLEWAVERQLAAFGRIEVLYLRTILASRATTSAMINRPYFEVLGQLADGGSLHFLLRAE